MRFRKSTKTIKKVVITLKLMDVNPSMVTGSSLTLASITGGGDGGVGKVGYTINQLKV